MKNLVTIHLTRALLAAFIAWVMGTSSYFLSGLTRYLWGHGSLPEGVLLQFTLAVLPTISAYVAILIGMILLSMLSLWCIPAFRRLFPKAWVAGIAGAGMAIFLSPFWIQLIHVQLQGGQAFPCEECLHLALRQSPHILLIGGILAFLHAFLVHRALERKAWLESTAARQGP